MGEDVADDVGAHAEGFLARGLAVAVDVLVFPSVAEVALPGEEAYQAAFPYQAVTLGRQVVVFVDLG